MKRRAGFALSGPEQAVPVRSIRFDAQRNRIVVVIDHECHTEIRVVSHGAGE